MAKSKITITFNSVPSVDSVVTFYDDFLDSNFIETFKTNRLSNFQSKIGTSASETALNYYNSLNVDYNSIGVYNISIIGNSVTVEAKQDNVTFSEITNTTSGAVTTSAVNETVLPSLTIDSISYSSSDADNCNYVKVTVTTSELATSISSPVVVDPNTSNPFSFDWIRGTNIDITCTNGTTSDSENITTPSVLAIGNVVVDIFNTPTGGNVTINVSNKSGLSLQYSLDNSTWQTSNVFPGLLEGTFTIYVKDQLGCSVNKTFDIDVFTPSVTLNSAFSYIAKEMSIRYKRDVVWDNFSVYKTEENTLSCEEKINKGGIIYPFIQKFQTVDIITTQLLSNYSDISANVINEDGTKDALDIVQKSDYINIKDYRDATYYKYSDTQLAIYFTSGDTYDYTTGLSNGTYTLNGSLPSWGVIGNYIQITSLGWFEIVAIDYDDDVSADVLIVDYVYSGTPTIEKVGSIYNFKNYNIFEFDLNCFDYQDKYIQIEILQNDDTFGECNYLSEVLYISETQEDTLELKWYNPTDTFVYYSTGIVNKCRIDFSEFEPSNESDLEIHNTDTTTIMLSSDSYETMTLVLDKLSSGIMRQLTKAFLHKELYIDGVKYITNKAPETEIVKNTNTHKLTVTLTKSGNVFNSEFNGTES